jgi:hypothetical protein
MMIVYFINIFYVLITLVYILCTYYLKMATDGGRNL